jgi:hypothetical protein
LLEICQAGYPAWQRLEAVPRRPGLACAKLLGLAGIQDPADDAGQKSDEQFFHGTVPLVGESVVLLVTLNV